MEVEVKNKKSKVLLISDIKSGQTFTECGVTGVFIKTSNGAVHLSTGREYMGLAWVWGALSLVECDTVTFVEVN